jgi:hypothetical protein
MCSAPHHRKKPLGFLLGEAEWVQNPGQDRVRITLTGERFELPKY